MPLAQHSRRFGLFELLPTVELFALLVLALALAMFASMGMADNAGGGGTKNETINQYLSTNNPNESPLPRLIVSFSETNLIFASSLCL